MSKQEPKQESKLESSMQETEIQKIKNAGDEADPLNYYAGEVLKEIRQVIVNNPEDPTYQFARKIVGAYMGNNNDNGGASELVNEGVMLGVYKILDGLVSKILKK